MSGNPKRGGVPSGSTLRPAVARWRYFRRCEKKALMQRNRPVIAYNGSIQAAVHVTMPSDTVLLYKCWLQMLCSPCRRAHTPASVHSES